MTLARRVVRVLPTFSQRILRRLIARGRAIRPPYRFSFPTAGNEPTESPFGFVVDPENPLERLGAIHAPSKRLQNYLPYYWMHFRDIRLHVRNVLEIGVESGSSLRMWEEFFPNAVIHGIDIDPRCADCAGGRRRIFIGDQSDYRFLESVVRQAGLFDVVIDDGSHQPDHQLRTFDFLFPAMSDHGIYVVEDTGIGDGLRAIRSLTTLVDKVNYWPPGVAPSDWPYVSTLPHHAGWPARHVIGVAFYRWIAFVMRGRNPEDNPFLERTGPE